MSPCGIGSASRLQMSLASAPSRAGTRLSSRAIIFISGLRRHGVRRRRVRWGMRGSWRGRGREELGGRGNEVEPPGDFAGELGDAGAALRPLDLLEADVDLLHELRDAPAHNQAVD